MAAEGDDWLDVIHFDGIDDLDPVVDDAPIQHVDDEVKDLLLQIQDGQVVDQDAIEALKARKLIIPQINEYYFEYAPKKTKPATDLTRDNLLRQEPIDGFVERLYKALQNPANSASLKWSTDGSLFVIVDEEKFTDGLLQYISGSDFIHMNNFNNILTGLGFARIRGSERSLSYQNLLFFKGGEHFLHLIKPPPAEVPPPLQRQVRVRPQSSAAKVRANIEVTQILMYLPARSLLRFKCVSKHWHSLISNPEFRNRHTLQNPNPNISAVFFLKWSSSDFYSIPLPNNESSPSSSSAGCPSQPLNSIKHPAGIEILQSCNGLLLCGSCLKINKPWIPYVLSVIPKYCEDDKEDIQDMQDIRWIHYVLNPTTSQFFTLPATITSRQEDIWSVALAFDPAKSIHYKVVCVFWDVSSLDIEIYSSETRSWSLGASTFDDEDAISYITYGYHYGVYCNGAIHWMNWRGTLVYYDINEERFGVVHSSPDFKEDWENFHYFGESGGHLLRIDGCSTDKEQLGVLELRRDYSGWSVKYRIDLRLMMAAFPEMVHSSLLLDFLFFARAENENEEDKDSSLVLHIPRKLISYNLRDNTWKILCDLTPKGSVTLQVRGWVAYCYKETLACV